MKWHYVYRITNRTMKKHYYGSRSSKVEPRLDLGIHYFSSSQDKSFIQQQKENPNMFKYKVLKTFKSRDNALLYECKLHKKFSVGSNPHFYNKVAQTSKGFSTYGGIFINGTFISSEEYKNQNVLIYHTRGKCLVVNQDGENLYVDVNSEYARKYKPFMFGKIIAKNEINGIEFFRTVTKDEYYKNPTGTNHNDRVPCYDSNGEFKLIKKDDPDFLSGNFKHVSTGFVSCKHKHTGEFLVVTIDEFRSNRDLVGVNAGVVEGSKNPKAKRINIYDANGNLCFKCHGDFKKICDNNGLPHVPLRKSHISNGSPIGKTQRQKNALALMGKLEYAGWYAREV